VDQAQHQGVDFGHEPLGGGIGAEVAPLDGLHDGAAQGGAPARDLAVQVVAQRAFAVVQLKDAGAVHAAGMRLHVPRAHNPALHNRVQPWQAFGALHGGYKHIDQKTPAELVDHGFPQGLARTDA